MKKLTLTILTLLAAIAIRAQSQNPDAPILKPTENTTEEIFGMLKLLGVEAWRFDLSEFSDGEYRFTPFLDEYADGEKVDMPKSPYPLVIDNWRQKSDDPDEWSKFVAERKQELRMSADGEKWLSFESMGVYIVPKNDSTIMAQVNFYSGGASGRSLKLKPLQNTEDNPRYLYDYRPFKIEPLESGKQRIPLLLVGSFWWDEKFGIHRFCGANEFAPDMSNEELESIPHYYVIGIEVERIE